MSIMIKHINDERGVTLGSLSVGDTFMYNNRVGVIASRNGHAFPMDLTTCHEMFVPDTYPFAKALPPEVVVLPVEVEMTYKVVG